MRTLDRNERLIYYALRKSSAVTEYGEEIVKYTDPVPCRVCVQIGQTGNSISPSGVDVYCDAKLITADMNLPWDDFTVFWIDSNPVTDEYDYIMSSKPRRRVNNITYNLRRRGDL